MTTTGSDEHSCYVCDAPTAPWSFGWPGPVSKRRDDTFLWGCSEHHRKVERINDERIGRTGRAAHPTA